MPQILCPRCGSENVDRDADAGPGPGIAVRCLDCGECWRRRPTPSCRRCGSTDVEQGVVNWAWAYDDPDEARDAPQSASWSYLDKSVFRCRHCFHEWQSVEGVHPFEPRA